MQLMTEGFIHCDPHEGNLLSLEDGRLALLDYGLMAQDRKRSHSPMFVSIGTYIPLYVFPFCHTFPQESSYLRTWYFPPTRSSLNS